MTVQNTKEQELVEAAHQAALSHSSSESSFISPDSIVIKGIDFNDENWNYSDLFSRIFMGTGFQATNLCRAIEIVNEMLSLRKQGKECKIFLGYTSNMISSGIRETVKYLVQHKLVDCIVTSAGGVEEDFIKCLDAPTNLGSFELKGSELRKQGLNRIGNLIVPNNNYCKFEDWVIPILDQLLEEQKTEGVSWSPSKIINRLGKEINNEESVYYWAYKNDIPVFCPALTDGSLGDMIYFHSYKNPGLVIDLVQDIRAVNSLAVFAQNTGMIILGGGVVKHHICNANLMRNGADFAVFINTGQEFDGSDSGARPDEAVSWGKIKVGGQSVKVYTDASLVFPILVAETFVKASQPTK